MTKFDPQIHHRHSIRLQEYDYSRVGAYYVTTAAYRRERLFGEVIGGEMKLSRFGQIVGIAWLDLPNHYPQVALDAFCIMPDHVHAIIVLNDNVGVKRHPLSEVVRAFKSFSARRINALRKTPGVPVWQRNFYEHIIRDQDDYLVKSGYIQNNPLNWETDDDF